MADQNPAQSTSQMAPPWFYMSFAADDGFLGGAYVCAWTEADAVTRSHVLEINPGGEIMLVGPIDYEAIEANVVPENRERLLSRSELGAIGG